MKRIKRTTIKIRKRALVIVKDGNRAERICPFCRFSISGGFAVDEHKTVELQNDNRKDKKIDSCAGKVGSGLMTVSTNQGDKKDEKNNYFSDFSNFYGHSGLFCQTGKHAVQQSRFDE